jgi:hypothetical protein
VTEGVTPVKYEAEYDPETVFQNKGEPVIDTDGDK